MPLGLSLCGADNVRGRVKFLECCGNLVAGFEQFPGRQLPTFTLNLLFMLVKHLHEKLHQPQPKLFAFDVSVSIRGLC